MRMFIGAAAALALSAIAASADPVGKYQVSGTNPGNGSAYSGEVSVQRTGDTFKVTWTVGGKRYDGTGIGSSDFIAVSYRAGNDTGLALCAQDGEGWKGIWAYAGSQKLGTEVWERQ